MKIKKTPARHKLRNAKKPTKTLCVLQVLPRLKADGGVEASTLECAEGLIKSHHVSLVAAADGPLKKPLKKLGAKVFIMPLATKNPLVMFFNSIRLWRLIKKHKPHLVHARSRAPAWSALWASKMAGIPFVTTFHGLYGTKFWLKRAYNSVMLKGKAVVVASKFMAHHLEEVYATPPAKIFLNPRGVNLRKFLPTKKKFAEPTVVMPSRLSRWKGQMLALEGLALMVYPPKIIFLGGGSENLKNKLATKAKKLGLRIEFRPATSNPQRIMAQANVILSASSKPEAFGRTPLEAQALGVCPIAPASGGALEIITDGENGFLFKPNDANSLAKALAKAMSQKMSPQWRHKMANNAKKFSHINTAKGYLKFYSLQVSN